MRTALEITTAMAETIPGWDYIQDSVKTHIVREVVDAQHAGYRAGREDAYATRNCDERDVIDL